MGSREEGNRASFRLGCEIQCGLPDGSMFGGGSSLRYYCMNCGTKHNQLACPKCDSKLKKVG
jgi:hypothetical protein